MGLEINFFDSVEHLEPRCPKCRNKIEYDVSTKYDSRLRSHVCVKCGHILK